MQEKVFTVPNISCGHCVMTIKNELSELAGVSEVQGSPETKKITVNFDSPATEEKIRDTLREINYPAQ